MEKEEGEQGLFRRKGRLDVTLQTLADAVDGGADGVIVGSERNTFRQVLILEFLNIRY